MLPASSSTPTPIRTARVLVVEDDPDMRLYLRGCLRALGFKDILETGDGETALKLAHEPDIGLVVSDVVMPGMDGHALARALKADAATAEIPLLLVSGETRPHAGAADAFLRKPFNTAVLREHVERLLGESR